MKKKKITNKTQILSPENYIRQKSKNLPLGKCYITKGWDEQKMAQLIILREHVTGNITACFYLIDLGCLGIKDTMYKFNVPVEEIEESLEYQKEAGAELMEISYELAHNIIYAAIEYADEYGFKPHKDFTSITEHFLEEDTEDIPLMKIECGGEDGNPLYVNSGLDSPVRVRQIVAQLNKTAGEGNYHYIIPYDEDGDENDSEDDDEDDEEDEEMDEIMEEIEQMTIDEQQKMFFDLINKNTSDDTVSEADAKRIMVLVNSLSYDMTSDEAINEQLDIMEKKFARTIVEIEELPNSLFTGVQPMDGKTVADLFTNVLDSIVTDNHPKKTITAFRKEIGDAPVSDFLELMYMKHKQSKKLMQKLEEAAQKHPRYFLIQTYACSILQHEEIDTIVEKLEQLLYNEQQPITRFEINAFFMTYTIHLTLDDNVDIATILAYEDYIEHLDVISDDTFTKLSSIVQICKVNKFLAHLQQTGEM